MATGGVFTIITNDGKQDRMLMATALLHDRLDKIWRLKRAANPGVTAPDDIKVLPTLLDVEKTHILFTNAHYKPFAAIGFEYNKVRANTGSTSLGQTVQFAIPQFGDFLSDIALHVVLTQPTVTVTATEAEDGPAMRWTNFPGERLAKRVQKEVSGNPLDEYSFHAASFHRIFRVAPNKRVGWDRCVGQEVPEEGFVRQRDWAASGAAPESFRVASRVHVGNQTPTASKSTALEMFIPLLFWYNKDVRLSIPSAAIPSQTFINIDLATAGEMVNLLPRGSNLASWAAPGGTLSDPSVTTCELYVNNIFINPEVHKIYIKRVGFSLIRVHRQQVVPMSSSEIHLNQLKWPIEYMYVAAKVRDYFAGSTDALKRQHLQNWDQCSVVNTSTYNVAGQLSGRLDHLTTAPTTATLGVATTGVLSGAATANLTLANGDAVIIGGGLYLVTVGQTAGSALNGVVTVAPAPTTAITASNAVAAASYKVTFQGTEIQTSSRTDIFDTVTIQAHGVDMYKEMPRGFLNAYTTYSYGGPNINTPADSGALFIPFCLYPGTYQPSGHINVSRAREFYFKYTSSYQDANPSVALMLVVVASAINFLLISDGSAVLRYST